MARYREDAEAATAALLRVLSATPGTVNARAVTDIIEQAIDGVSRAQEKHELQRVADIQASAHAHLTRLLNASPAVIYCRLASGDYHPTFVSDSVTRLFGCTPRDYLDNPYLWRDRVHPDDVARINAWVDTLFTREDDALEYRVRRDDGSYFWVNDEQHVISDANGEPFEIVGSWTDITARKEAEEAQASRPARLSLLLERGAVGDLQLRGQRRFRPDLRQRQHPAHARLPLRRISARRRVLAEPRASRRPPGDRGRAGAIVRERRASRRVPLPQEDGSYCWVSDEQHLIRDEHGAPLEVVGSWSNIDARKEAEQALLATQAELEKASQAAMEASEAKSAFLANMSHEIRTPMNAVIGLSHLALKTELAPRQRDYIVKIKHSGQHLLGIINDILDFSKIEAGKLAIENIDFDLDKVLENVGNLISEKASAKGLELIFDIEPSVSPSSRAIRCGSVRS